MPTDVSTGGSLTSKPERQMVLERFKGVDLTSNPVNVAASRSPSAPNMMPDADGFPTKRPGWRTAASFGGAIYGHYTFTAEGQTVQLLHAGDKLYRYDTDPAQAEEIYSGMAEADSWATQLTGRLWILDGKRYLCYDGQTVRPVSEIATVPTVTIGKSPDGQTGATSYQPINLLTGRRTESYLGTQGTTVYYLSFTDLTEEAVTARKLNGDGEWSDLAEGTDFTVDRESGRVTFATAPGVSPVTGEDNVTITYSCASRAEEIDGCRFGIQYGVGGALDRIFFTGNTAQPNVDWWSEFRDPAYVGDTFFGQLGSETSPIVGYGVLGTNLVTYKSGEENSRNCFVRSGALDGDGFAEFTISHIVQGEPCASWRTCQSLNSEPIFLTSLGVTALTAGDITGERYSQVRSHYINAPLKALEHPERCCSVVWDHFYALAAEDRLYLLDGEQREYASGEPYSSHQYEGYYFTDIGARVLWVVGRQLWFGTEDGKVRSFRSGVFSEDFMDDGQPYEAHWATPQMNFGEWSRLKNVTASWVTLQPYTRSGADVYFMTDKAAEYLARSGNVDMVNFDDVDFDRWTFATTELPTVMNLRKRVRGIKMMQIIVRNARPNEPMGVYAININFRLGGKVKK